MNQTPKAIYWMRGYMAFHLNLLLCIGFLSIAPIALIAIWTTGAFATVHIELAAFVGAHLLMAIIVFALPFLVAIPLALAVPVPRRRGVWSLSLGMLIVLGIIDLPALPLTLYVGYLWFKEDTRQWFSN